MDDVDFPPDETNVCLVLGCEEEEEEEEEEEDADCAGPVPGGDIGRGGGFLLKDFDAARAGGCGAERVGLMGPAASVDLLLPTGVWLIGWLICIGPRITLWKSIEELSNNVNGNGFIDHNIIGCGFHRTSSIYSFLWTCGLLADLFPLGFILLPVVKVNGNKSEKEGRRVERWVCDWIIEQ